MWDDLELIRRGAMYLSGGVAVVSFTVAQWFRLRALGAEGMPQGTSHASEDDVFIRPEAQRLSRKSGWWVSIAAISGLIAAGLRMIRMFQDYAN